MPDENESFDMIERTAEEEFSLSVVRETRQMYVESVLQPESNVERQAGFSHASMSSEIMALMRTSREALKEANEDADEPNEVPPVDNIPSFDSESVTRGRIRSLGSEIFDLKSRWDDFNISEIDGGEVISEIEVSNAIEAANQTIESEEEFSISDEELSDLMENPTYMVILEHYAESWYQYKLHDLCLRFYILYQTVVEEETISWLDEEIIAEDYQGSNNTFEFLEALSQPTREELLERTGSIEPHIVSKMTQNRRLRNSLAHSFHGEDNYGVAEIAADEIGRCGDVLEKFDEGADFSWERIST